MWKAVFISALATLMTSSSALACSCMCTYGEKVSEYFDDNKLFWGVPLGHEYTEVTYGSGDYSYTKVTTRVRVIEAYGQAVNNSVIEINSREEDGVTCGYQYKLDELQLISTHGMDNAVSTCNCRPPLSMSLDYLLKNKDQYLPRRDVCEGAMKRRDRTKRLCRISDKSWASDSANSQAIIAELKARMESASD